MSSLFYIFLLYVNIRTLRDIMKKSGNPRMNGFPDFILFSTNNHFFYLPTPQAHYIIALAIPPSKDCLHIPEVPQNAAVPPLLPPSPILPPFSETFGSGIETVDSLEFLSFQQRIQKFSGFFHCFHQGRMQPVAFFINL